MVTYKHLKKKSDFALAFVSLTGYPYMVLLNCRGKTEFFTQQTSFLYFNQTLTTIPLQLDSNHGNSPINKEITI